MANGQMTSCSNAPSALAVTTPHRASLSRATDTATLVETKICALTSPSIRTSKNLRQIMVLHDTPELESCNVP